MAKVTTGAYPVFDIVFKIGTKGLSSEEADMVSIKDMESFSISIESNVEKWNPMDQGGWGRSLATAKAGTVSLKGKRSVGDKGNDYVYTVLWLSLIHIQMCIRDRAQTDKLKADSNDIPDESIQNKMDAITGIVDQMQPLGDDDV